MVSARLPAPWSVALRVPATGWQRLAAWLSLASGAPQPSAATYLAADALGRWAIGQATEPSAGAPSHWQPVVIETLWRGPCWWTLRLLACGQSARRAPRAARVWTLTLWRNRYPARDWRLLCVLLRAWRGPQPVHSAPGAAVAHGA